MTIHRGSNAPQPTHPSRTQAQPFTVELPEPNELGERIYIKCRPLSLILLTEILEGGSRTPDETEVTQETTVDVAIRSFRKAIAPTRRLIEAAVIEPKFRFDTDGDADHADFWAMSSENQGALVTAITMESGFIKKGSAASKAASFPEEPQGASGGGTGDAPVPAAEEAE